jgi:putative sugar O-methyltransferase
VISESEPFLDPSALEAGLAPRAKPPALPGNDEPLLKRIQAFYRAVKEEQRNQPEIYQPAGEWREHVDRRMPHYQAFHDSSTDRLAHLLGNFWRNELGVLVKQYASFEQLVHDSEKRDAYSRLMAHDLMIWTHLMQAEVSELAIPEVGHPWGYLWKGTLIGSKVLRYDVLARQVRDITADLPRPVIGEVGAGYGGMAYFLLRGSGPLAYVDFDLPETLAVAAYYLSKCLPHRRVYLHKGGAVAWHDIVRDHDVILLPNWCIDTLPADSVDLFLNSFSLSEMTYPVIERYLDRIAACCRGYFLHNNMDRPGVVNEGHERVPGSRYPLPPDAFKLLYKRYDLFQQRHSGRDGDYREFLYQRIRGRAGGSGASA